MDTKEIIKELRKHMTKWKISTTIGVSWQSVHSWEKGFTKPTIEHKEALEKIYQEAQ